MSDASVFDLRQMVCALHHLDALREKWMSQRTFHRLRVRAERGTEHSKRRLPDHFDENHLFLFTAGRCWPALLHGSWLVKHRPMPGRNSSEMALHPEDISPGESIIQPSRVGARKPSESTYTSFRVTHPIAIASFVDYSRMAGRGQVLIASWNGSVRPYAPEEVLMIQRVRQLPAICGDECSRDLVGEKVQEILTANGAETSEQDYENLAASTSQKDKILTQAIRTGHAWRLFKVDSEGTHLTDSGRLYNYAVSRLSGHKVPGRDRDTAMSYDFRNAKINSFQQGGFNSGSHTFNDHGMNQTQMEQASDLIRLLLVEAPGLVSAATELHTELRRVEQEGGAPDRRRTGSVLSNITNGLSAGSAALALAEAIRDSLGL